MTAIHVVGADPPLTEAEQNHIEALWRLGGEEKVYALLDQWLLDGRGWNRVQLGSPEQRAPDALGVFGKVLVNIRMPLVRDGRINDVELDARGVGTFNRRTRTWTKLHRREP